MKFLSLKPIKSQEVVQGVSSHVFLHNFPVVLVLVFLALAYISVRFDCITAMETVKKLRNDLEITRTEVKSERSRYMSATCESSMQAMVDSLQLGLTIQERPAYQITIPE